MNTHFCRVGKIRLNTGGVLNLRELERRYLNFIEEAYNSMQTDASLSDFLYHEASKLKKNILQFKNTSTSDIDAAI